jgi:aerobic carbon-monoxide dehydrogenase medium subunit
VYNPGFTEKIGDASQFAIRIRERRAKPIVVTGSHPPLARCVTPAAGTGRSSPALNVTPPGAATRSGSRPAVRVNSAEATPAARRAVRRVRRPARVGSRRDVLAPDGGGHRVAAARDQCAPGFGVHVQVTATVLWPRIALTTLAGDSDRGCGQGRQAEAPRSIEGAAMKLPPVEYEAPKTVSEAVALLAEHQDQASVLAGGQSLIPLLALRLARPAVLIDINGIAELAGVSAADGWVAIGAMTREYVAEESGTVAGTVPLLAAALPLIGHEAIRSRGTIGGSLAHADPAAELPAVARALDAEFVLRGQAGERVVPAAEWFEGYLTTSRRPDELLIAVRFPTAGPGTGTSFREVARRHGDFAIVGLAASLTLSDGAISGARLAFAGMSDVPVRAAGAEDLLVGEAPSAELFDEAARRATDGIDPPADLHGSAEYRKKVAAALVRRGLRAAVDNAQERND